MLVPTSDLTATDGCGIATHLVVSLEEMVLKGMKMACKGSSLEDRQEHDWYLEMLTSYEAFTSFLLLHTQMQGSLAELLVALLLN